MSEPMLISPMLDNFIMGNPISEHNGVRCCPAMAKESDDKYIVKIISIPASQMQMEALLLSGAYADKEAALSYYQELVNGIDDEVNILNKLSQLEGFLPYENTQAVPMPDGIGFDVYLLSAYRNTLARYYHKSAMTHLGAINLGLDLCAALAVCRKSGYLYVDLKPDNVYITPEGSYRIGDLGFIKLNSLKYASLPDRYRSIYTAPEINDAYAALNTTMDTYAVGLILYQAFNDGQLPFNGSVQPGEVLPPPAYADYEMAEIILKACNPDPAKRWTDPIEMGQAIISYMQRNGAHDTPIVPVPEPVCEAVSEEETDDTPQVIDEDKTEEAIKTAETAKEIGFQIPESDDIADASEAENEEEQQSSQEELSDAALASSEATEQAVQSDLPEITEENIEEITEESIYSEDAEGNLTFLDEALTDETSPDHLAEEIDYNEVSDEVTEILNQADALIAHPTPDPVVQPEPIDIPMPAPIVPEEDVNDEPSDEVAENSDNAEKSDTTEESVVAEEPAQEEETATTVKKSHWVRNLILALLAVGLLVGGFFFYKNYYLQPIETIVLEGTDDGSLTVVVNSDISEDKLTVVCSDTYGNQLTQPVVNGKAVFEGLAPNSAFTVQVVIDGFHRLIGNTSAAYTTPTQTNIVQFTAVTGAEDGSVVLGFAIEGPDAEQWKISYHDDNNHLKESTFSGHILTLNGLTVGNDYTFELQPVDPLNITGTTTVTHKAGKLIFAENVMITGCIDNILTASWTAPKNASVANWTVRCYNDNGYNETIVTDNTTAAFTINDISCKYTVEVTAAGMSMSSSASASANATTITEFRADDSNPNQLALSWNAGILEPEGGWVVVYSIDGSSSQEMSCLENRGIISPVIPGRTYTISLRPADGTDVLGGELVYTAADAGDFSGYGVSRDFMKFNMCRTPSYSGWNRYDLSSSDYTTTFEVGEKASFLVRMLHEYDTSDDNIITVFAVEDENGNIVEASTSEEAWINMWYRNYCELDIPDMPDTPGDYTMYIYFNGALAGKTDFTVISD